MKVDWIDRDPRVSVYQSRAYGEAAVLSSGAQWDVLGSEDGRWRVALAISSIAETGMLDAASPYGYPGIHADPGLSTAEIAAAWNQTVDAMRARGIVSAFFRFAPYRTGVESAVTLGGMQLVELSETVLVPLGDEGTMWDSMQGRSRTAVRKAQREGLVARVVDDLPAALAAPRGFRHVYEEAMRRVSASPIHFHPSAYYERLASSSDLGTQLIEVRDGDDRVVAATLLFEDAEGVHYHLSGSLVEGARNGANNLMIWTAMTWAASRGLSRIHLGGGTSRGDGLYRFKASFGGESLPFRAGRVILREQDYTSLLHERAGSLRVSPEKLRESSFFPAYRAGAA